jgi:hypothetical protein
MPLLARISLLTISTALLACASSTGGTDELGTTSETGTSETSSTETSSTETGSTDSTGETSSTETTTDGDSTDATETTTETTGAGEFTLTSPAFAEGGAIPLDHACYGANLSPQLDWTNAPPETASFAVFFRDLTIDFEHSAIFDIPADLDGLPADVDKTAMPADVPGATQPRSYANMFGYAGPCPGSAHTYEFTVYAIDVANLAELDQNSSLPQVQNVLEQHALASATLSGVFTPP